MKKRQRKGDDREKRLKKQKEEEMGKDIEKLTLERASKTGIIRKQDYI